MNKVNRLAEKRSLYRQHHYYYTSLRFMVEIFKGPKPKNIIKYHLYKTHRCYVIDTDYTVVRNSGMKMDIPVKIRINIKSKDRKELMVSVPDHLWWYDQTNNIRSTLKEYYLNLKK